MVIVKVGGSEGIDYEMVCQDVADLTHQGRQVVLIHGGSHLTNEVAEALVRPAKFVTSPSGYTSRVTDRPALEIFEMVYCGKVNKEIVEMLQRKGVNALGLSGIDGGLWQGPRKKAIRAVQNGRTRIIRNNFTGRVEKVNGHLLHTLIDNGFLPVLTPPAISYEGEAINVDGDRAAAATAEAMQADDLLILSNIAGVLQDFPDESTLISEIEKDNIEFVKEHYTEGRMRIKLLGAQEALAGGVKRVVIGDARVEQPIQRALAGMGTVIQ